MRSNIEHDASLAEGKEGYKETKLGWIPEDWTTPTINQVFEFLKTTSFSRNQLNYDIESETYYIHYGDIHSTYKNPLLDFEIETNIPKLNKNVVLPNSIQYLKDGDVIIADASEDYEGVGEAIEIINLNGNAAISGLHTFALRDLDNKTVAGFRTYIFKNPIVKKALKTIATGSKVFGISKSNVQKFKIVLPTIPEQQKIATILNTWDKAIAAQEKLIAQKQELKKGLMQQLLTGKKRFAGYEEEWEEVRLKEVLNLSSGKTKPKKFSENNSYDLMIPVYGGNGISGYTNEVFLDGTVILIGRVGEYCGVIHFVSGNIWITDNCMYTKEFNPDNSIVFFAFLLEHYQLDRLRNKGGQPLVSQKPILNLKIKKPCIQEQQKIAEVLTAADNEITALKQQLEKLKIQKQGVMQQLLTGKIRVKT